MQINLELEPLDNGLENASWPFLLAGPCSAESKEQLMDTAKQLQATQRVSAFRAGIWKPRTRPGSFEGIGEPGLQWLQEVKAETGLRTAVEVASAAHTELALKYDVDVLWVGARSSANPFTVQEIADALKGTDKIVFVKNPVSPDLPLWMGALERINRAGIKKLGAIHRGFSSHEASVFRNVPMWHLAIELKKICPNLPIICDPSHISGKRELVSFVAQKALDINMNGLMIEVHNNPSCALSDAEQQLTPDTFAQVISDLMLRFVEPMTVASKNILEEYRKQLDEIDDDLIQMLSNRMKISQKIGQYKQENNVMVLQMNRWEEILNHRVKMGVAMGLNAKFIKQQMEIIHDESIRIQTKLMNREPIDE